MSYIPLGDGWVEGPIFPPELAKGPQEVVRYEVAEVGHEDRERARVWHRPLRQLPTHAGYYVAARPSYGDTVVVELLAGDRGWVDAGDRTYLTEEQVRDLGPLVPLVRVDEILALVALQLEGETTAEGVRRSLDEIPRLYYGRQQR